ncbi:titin isoform X2 [Eupeodes corollae]|nr:titin isoform X2 [Eupeodes corollae]XP_055916381.1 titin isoform X2 [Eupeodes corollae]XP_055916382.1 titin isoform X2 [Eupeodes corollae]XP_055916383.1 titin isoform X2 [Eupeodes corollae]XP_055916384.1 titin isoform X2 [Eupeodes corollae]XP_055916385.1 titin isoform X2 [Eupeodes corollae]
MMEVKHSPSSQMDFRNATNGLPTEEEDEEMDTLLESSAAVKNKPNSSLECESSTPILNGNSKYSGLEEGMELDLLEDDMDEELNSTVCETENKKDAENTTAQTDDIDIFDLDLEQEGEAEEKVTNGETTDPSNVRDAGDDLDTLLSKINDLVEDCMEPPSAKVDSSTVVNKRVSAQIEDEEVKDVTVKAEEDEEKTQEDASCLLEMDERVEEAFTVDDSQVETEKIVESKSEEKAETEEDVTRDEEALEDKSVPNSPEDVAEENGLELTGSDLEIAEGETLKEVDEQISEVCAEEIVDTVEEEVEEKIEEEEETVEEMLVQDTAEEEGVLAEEIPAAETAEAPASDIVKQTEEEVVKESIKLSESIPADSMDIDDDIVCLDSPLPEEKEEETLLDTTEPAKEEDSLPSTKNSIPASKDEKEEKEPSIEKEVLEKEIPSKEISPPEETIATNEKNSSTALEEDDDIFLIEDDDEPMKETESKDTEKPTTSKEGVKIPEKEKLSHEELKLDEIDKEKEEKKEQKEESPVEKNKEASIPENEAEQIEKKTEVVSEKKPSETREEDDDDVVCLDDSIEETEDPKQDEKTEEKPTEVIPTNAADKVANDVDLPEVEKVTEKEDIAAESVHKESKTADEKVDKAKVDESEEKSEQLVKSSEEVVKSTAEAPTSSDAKEIPQATPVPEVSAKILLETDVINLDDDDEDEAVPSAAEKKDTTSSAEIAANKPSAFFSDNSDNARDGAEEKEDKNEPKDSVEKSTPMPSEPNSNSSSNLLKESNAIERDESRSEPNEQPPAKRIRLSQDEASSRNSNASQEDTTSKLLDDDDVMEINDNDDEENKTLKRVHSSESISSDFKKPKTDVESSKVEEEKPQELLEEIIPAKVEPVKAEEKPDMKSVDAKPLPLYPPPNFNTPKVGLSLDFLRRFKKSIHKMNKSDLEELVLQKIVEAIVHKSEFSEMRELIEKQEKIISGHRSKITELNKQFRDLEMVHNRVLKDLETKNSQFIMPVKITRAVGLQVFFPNKKYDQPMASLPASSSAHTPSPTTLARSISASSNTNSIPEKTPVSTSTSMTNSAPHAPLPVAPQGANQPRRGCVQKLTPMRPDGPRSAMPNRGVAPGVVSSSTPSPMTPKDTSPKILNRQVTPKSRLSQSPMGQSNASNSGLPQQAHNLHALATPTGPDPERAKAASIMSQGIATKKTGGMVKSFPASKRIPKSWQSEPQAPAQPSPTTAQNASSPMGVPQSPALNSPLVAKTPNKSVIDLTDEDDVAPTPSPKAPNAMTASQKQANTGMHRVGPYKVSVVPASQLQQQQQQQPRPIHPKAPLARPPQNAAQSAAKPNGTAANAVRRTPPLPQRYRHPAPLPNQPIHSSNPLWKLPPARPTIRISNLDSGIVISWTIEDTAKEKYAESTSYQIYAYQETSGPPLVESWRHVGDVKAMLLPMAVTLTQFQEGQRYYFAVRAVDAHNRCGPFSFAKTWS